jgi:hypothetical protein
MAMSAPTMGAGQLFLVDQFASIPQGKVKSPFEASSLKGLKHQGYLAGLSPKPGFVAAKPIQRTARIVRELDKAAGEGVLCWRSDDALPAADVFKRVIVSRIVGVSLPEGGNALGMIGEQPALDGGRTAQAPEKACQAKNELSFNC